MLLSQSNGGLLYLIRRKLSEQTASIRTDHDIMALINEAVHYYAMRRREASSDGWVTTTVTTAADQVEYDLPDNCLEVRKVKGSATDSSGVPDPIRYDEYEQYLDNGRCGFYVREVGWEKKLGIVPTPSGAYTITISYVPRMYRVHYGTCGTCSATTLKLAPSPTAGHVEIEDDYFNGAQFVIASGTGSGQRRRCTDFVASTRVATVSPTWGTVPGTTAVYEVAIDLPEDVHYGIAEMVVAEANASENEPALTQRGDARAAEHVALLSGEEKRIQVQTADTMRIVRNKRPDGK